MLLIALAAGLSASSPAESAPLVPVRQAVAMVRVLRPARVELGEGASGGDQPAAVRETIIRDRDGSSKPAVLVEFS